MPDKIPPSTYHTGMRALRASVGNLPDRERYPNWERDLKDLMWRDVLGMVDGDQQRAAATMLYWFARMIGDAMFPGYGGDDALRQFNKALSFCESNYPLHLARGRDPNQL